MSELTRQPGGKPDATESSSGSRFGGLMARSGWAVGAGIGSACALTLLLAAGSYGEAEADIGPTAAVIAMVMLIGLIGALPGLLVGGIAQLLLRRGRAHRSLAGEPAEPAKTDLPDGSWATLYEQCRQAVRRFDAIVAATEPGAAQNWLVQLSADLAEELDETLRLARYGCAVSPDADPANPTVAELVSRLTDARRAFEEMVDQAGQIVLNLSSETDLGQIRAQLDMLASQAPHLRAD